MRRLAAALAAAVTASCVTTNPLERVPDHGVDPAPLRGRVVVLDPGHGGTRPGAVAPFGLREADVNLDVARRLAARLERSGARVRLTRETDRDVAPPDSPLAADLAARAALADSLGADLFVSIHHNATPETARRVQGTEVYWRALEGRGPSEAAAAALAPRLERALGTGRAAVVPGNYAVFRATTRPAVLGEAAYLSANDRVAQRLRWPGLRDREAAAYYAALAAHFAAADSWPSPSPLPPAETAPRERPRVLVDATGGRPGRAPPPDEAARLRARAGALAAVLRARGAEVDVVEGEAVEVLRVEHVRRPDLVVSFAERPETGPVEVRHYPASARGRAAAERYAAALPGAVVRPSDDWIVVQTASPAVRIVSPAGGDSPPADLWEAVE